MRGFASDFAPTSSECSVKAQVTNHQGSARAFRGRIQAHISAFFVPGWVDLNGLDSPFSELGVAFFRLITGVLENEYQGYLIFAQVARFSDTLTTCIRTIQTC